MSKTFKIGRLFFKPRLVLILIIIFLCFLFFLSNKYLFEQINIRNVNMLVENEVIDKHSGQNEILPDQIVLLNERINRLESNLDLSKKSVEELSRLMRNFNVQLQRENKNYAPTETNHKEADKSSIAVLVIACNRALAVDEHLNQLFSKRSASANPNKFPIIVSQDCNHPPTASAIEKHSKSLFAFLKQPDQSDIAQDKNGKPIPSNLKGYFKIARHFKWALENVFIKHGFESVIITEDDLNIADDFFDYFEAMHKVLQQDKSLFCVSAWNDNGKASLIDINRSDLVHRSDFFPGLGWMMRRDLWLELRDKWPLGFWDDWLRDQAQRKNRACLRPEISRTEMSIKAAKNGVSMGQFFDNYLKLIVLNKNKVDWQRIDNSYLIKSNYDAEFDKRVYINSQSFSFPDYLKLDLKTFNQNCKDKCSILLTYRSKEEFLNYAKYFGIMDDFKDGVPRTAYKGVVSIHFNSKQVFIAPSAKQEWNGYDSTW